jgi:hypothetical protein
MFSGKKTHKRICRNVINFSPLFLNGKRIKYLIKLDAIKALKKEINYF